MKNVCDNWHHYTHFHVKTTPEKLIWKPKKSSTIQENHAIMVVPKFFGGKLRFQNFFRQHYKARPAFWNSSGLKSISKSSVLWRISMEGRPNRRNKAASSNASALKSVFEKLRFRDGLVWMVSLILEIKLRLQMLPLWGAFSKSSVFVTC